jgi:hypothetical protein
VGEAAWRAMCQDSAKCLSRVAEHMMPGAPEVRRPAYNGSAHHNTTDGSCSGIASVPVPCMESTRWGFVHSQVLPCLMASAVPCILSA